jgi:hypothetical protein
MRKVSSCARGRHVRGPAAWSATARRSADSIAVELTAAKPDWSGRFRVEDMSAPIERVRVTMTGVHFEVPGEGVFDGTVAANLGRVPVAELDQARASQRATFRT